MTHHPDAYTGTSPADRVRAYLDARAGFQGLDQEDIHSVGIRDVVYELTTSDLKALLAASRPAAREAAALADSIAERAEAMAERINHYSHSRQPEREAFVGQAAYARGVRDVLSWLAGHDPAELLQDVLDIHPIEEAP